MGISVVILAGCSSNPTPRPPISLTPSLPQVVNQATGLTIAAMVLDDPNSKGVTWSLNPNVGSLIFQTPTSVTYVAPASVTSNFIVTITATSVENQGEFAPLVVTVV